MGQTAHKATFCRVLGTQSSSLGVSLGNTSGLADLSRGYVPPGLFARGELTRSVTAPAVSVAWMAGTPGGHADLGWPAHGHASLRHTQQKHVPLTCVYLCGFKPTSRARSEQTLMLWEPSLLPTKLGLDENCLLVRDRVRMDSKEIGWSLVCGF